MSPSPKLWSPCGLLVTVNGPEGRAVCGLTKPYARVGSHPRTEVRLPAAASEPCRLFFLATDLGVFYVDLEPFDTKQPYRHGWLAPNEAVSLGDYRLSAEALLDGRPVDFPFLEGRVSDLCKYGTAEHNCPLLDVYLRGQKIKERTLRRRLTLVGRKRPSTLLIEDGRVSKCHGAFYWRRQQLWYIDFLSANGSHREGLALDATQLQVGDRLELGEVELRFAGDAASGCEEPSGREVRQIQPEALIQSDHEACLATGAISDLRDSSEMVVLADDHTPATSRKNEKPEAGDPSATSQGRIALDEERRLLAEARRELESEHTSNTADRVRWKQISAAAPATAQADHLDVSPKAAARALAAEVALAPAVECPDGDPLDASLTYVLNRLVQREQKSQRKTLVLGLVAAALAVSIIAGAIAVGLLIR